LRDGSNGRAPSKARSSRLKKKAKQIDFDFSASEAGYGEEHATADYQTGSSQADVARAAAGVTDEAFTPRNKHDPSTSLLGHFGPGRQASREIEKGTHVQDSAFQTLQSNNERRFDRLLEAQIEQTKTLTEAMTSQQRQRDLDLRGSAGLHLQPLPPAFGTPMSSFYAEGQPPYESHFHRQEPTYVPWSEARHQMGPTLPPVNAYQRSHPVFQDDFAFQSQQSEMRQPVHYYSNFSGDPRMQHHNTNFYEPAPTSYYNPYLPRPPSSRW
jgi:hypothetical protein